MGLWDCQRTLVSVEGDAGAAEAAWRALGGAGAFKKNQPASYETRFVPPPTRATYEFEGREIDGVVLDRGFELDARGAGPAVWNARAPAVARRGDATLTVVSRSWDISAEGFGVDEFLRVEASAGGLVGGAARVWRAAREPKRVAATPRWIWSLRSRGPSASGDASAARSTTSAGASSRAWRS